MSSSLKTILKAALIRLTATSLRGLQQLSNWLPKPLRHLIKPIQKIGGFFLLVILLPFYKFQLGIKKIIKKFYAPHISRNHFIHPFARRYWVHAVVIIVSLFTTASNLNANEVRRDDFGQTSIVAALITTEDLGTIELEGPITTSVPSRYVETTGVEPQPKVLEGDATTDFLPSTVAGDSAVVRPILSPVEEELRRRDKIISYKVLPGDTLSEIADKFGITTNTILWENNLSSYNIIRPGDTLTILPSSGIRHKVAKGDTLEKIATKYKIDSEKIIEANKLASAEDIKIGEQLLITGGQKPYVRPTYTVRSTFYQPPPSSQGVVSSGQMVWPASCRRITQYYRYRHSGVDVACSYGSPVYAADSGRVIKSQGGYNGGYGAVIIIEHGNGRQTLYGHNSNLYVKVGENVAKGQSIAAMGSTGRSTGSHVHFEVSVGGVRANPLTYIR